MKFIKKFVKMPVRHNLVIQFSKHILGDNISTSSPRSELRKIFENNGGDITGRCQQLARVETPRSRNWCIETRFSSQGV